MARQDSKKREKKRQKLSKSVPGMARDATTVRIPEPKVGGAGPSNMMDRVLPTRHRMVRTTRIVRERNK
jgi:hypothetical protein